MNMNRMKEKNTEAFSPSMCLSHSVISGASHNLSHLRNRKKPILILSRNMMIQSSTYVFIHEVTEKTYSSIRFSFCVLFLSHW